MLDKLSYKTYSDALLQTAQDSSMSREGILRDLHKVLDIINSSEDLSTVFEIPTISAEQKIKIIEDVFSKEVPANILNLLKILAEKGKIGDIKQITDTFKEASDEIDGIKNISVISAIELEKKYKDSIIDKISKKLNKKVNCNWIVDNSIIGGLVVKIDDDVIDTSIKNKLEKLMKGSL